MSTRILGGASFTCVAWFVIVAGGCGEMVSSREYIDNSMTEYAYVDQPSDVYGYMPVRPATDRVIEIPNSQGQPIIYGRQGEPIREYGFYEGVITPGARSTYTSDVRNELDALERELQRIEARAEIKGAPALAA